MAGGDQGGEGAETPGDLQGQAGLFGPDLAASAAGRRARAESPVVDADEGQIERVFGRGRPAGASNIATRKRLELFARICGDPLLASARVQAMPLSELAGMLGATIKEAAEFQQRERFLAMPYVLSKRPQEVVLDDKRPPSVHLHFPLGAAAIGPGGGAVALFDLALKGRPGAVLDQIPLEEESDDVSTT